MSDLQLSSLAVSPEVIEAELRNYLAGTRTWAPIMDSPGTAMLVKLIAAVGGLDQAQILRVQMENFKETAVTPVVQYAMADSAGIRLRRKSPAKCTALLTSEDASAQLPAYSQFEYSGVRMFTRQTYILGQGLQVPVELYEGEVKSITTLGKGTNYSMFISPEGNFRVSDTDVFVYVNYQEIPKTTDGIWALSSTGYEDRTLPEGNLIVMFGNAVTGSRPTNADTVIITYVVTSGTVAHGLDCIGRLITSVDLPSIHGTITSSFSSGADELTAISYRNIPYPNYGLLASAVTQPQYNALALKFPGVIDAKVISQREINPKSLAWMNVLRLAVLWDESVFNINSASSLKTYMQERSIYGVELQIETALPIDVNVTIDVYCYAWAVLSQVQASVTQAIQALFLKRPGILGSNVYRSEITKAVIQSNSGISYMDLRSPTTDTIIADSYVSHPSFTVSTGGSLASGTYSYGVAVDTGSGLSTVHNWSSVTVGGSSSVTLTWPAIPGAVRYVVYGRNTGAEGVIGDVGPISSPTFTDIGTAPVGDVASVGNTSPVKYARLNTLQVTANYEVR